MELKNGLLKAGHMQRTGKDMKEQISVGKKARSAKQI